MSEHRQDSPVLGRYDEIYTDAEKELCVKVAMFLKTRQDKWAGRATRGDMDFYVRAAASLYELAKQLQSLAPLSKKEPPRTMDEWLRILTGQQFSYISGPDLVKNMMDITVSEKDLSVLVALPRPDAPTAEECEHGRAAKDDFIDTIAAVGRSLAEKDQDGGGDPAEGTVGEPDLPPKPG